ncbi:MAG: hypothetical protein OEZ68_14465 [Gammaproteobacteria bacterium]|nr:hypothetical protein [Gammaproteobacteria bacterium]MDH5802006.1 hypothetical protein [Gammaproteobacteria bacterium]
MNTEAVSSEVYDCSSYEFTAELDDLAISPVPNLQELHYQNPFVKKEADADGYLQSVLADNYQWGKYVLTLVVGSIVVLAAVPSKPAKVQKMEMPAMAIHGNSATLSK